MINFTKKYLITIIIAVTIIIDLKYCHLCFSEDILQKDIARSTIAAPSALNSNLPLAKGYSMPITNIRECDLRDIAKDCMTQLKFHKVQIALHFANLSRARKIINEHLYGKNTKPLLLIKNVPRGVYIDNLYPPFYREKKQFGIIEPKVEDISGIFNQDASSHLFNKLEKAKLIVFSAEHSLLHAILISLAVNADIVYIDDYFVASDLRKSFMKILSAVLRDNGASIDIEKSNVASKYYEYIKKK